MKPLATTFRKTGYDYQQIDRVGDVAIFSQAQGGRVFAWEVVVVQKCPDREIAGKPIPAHEALPGAELWGREGWTCTSPERAAEKMREVVAARAAREEARAA